MLSAKLLLCIAILICYIPQSFSSIPDAPLDTPTCTAGSDCICTEGEPECIIECDAVDLCKDVKIGCESTNDATPTSCAINCEETSSCEGSKIKANEAKDVQIHCEDENSCKSAEIVCNAIDDCEVNCKDLSSCEGVCIEGPQEGDNLEVNCMANDGNVCINAIIICPPRGDGDGNGVPSKCELNCAADSSTNSCTDVIVILNGNTLTGANQLSYYNIIEFDTVADAIAAGNAVPCVHNAPFSDECKGPIIEVSAGCATDDKVMLDGSGNCVIDCADDKACKNACIDTEDGDDVIVNCNGHNACKSAQIVCDATDDCVVNCDGDNGCSHICIEGPQSADDLVVNCNTGDNVCKQAVIICPPNDADMDGNTAACTLTCDSPASCVGVIVIINGNQNANIPDFVDDYQTLADAGLDVTDAPCLDNVGIATLIGSAKSVGVGNSINSEGNALNNGGLSYKIEHDTKSYDGDKTINYTISLSNELSMNLWGMIILFIFVNCFCWLAKGRVNTEKKEDVKEVYE